ncbi:MAG: hypothetical protein NT005_06050 [Spirochaetes bacterium]|jgi:hypothetical protein|nr:hypothetical protein [Spirochaetota bacterium]MCX7038676.1 hypothetical protein [Spirochaetota bacterium]
MISVLPYPFTIKRSLHAQGASILGVLLAASLPKRCREKEYSVWVEKTTGPVVPLPQFTEHLPCASPTFEHMRRERMESFICKMTEQVHEAARDGQSLGVSIVLPKKALHLRVAVNRKEIESESLSSLI